MALSIKIQEQVDKLPQSFQAEVLNFVEYLLVRAESEAERQDDNSWSDFSLTSALRDMEEEASVYFESDVKKVFL